MAARHAFDSIDSTQREAIRRARSGAEPGTVVVATLQTAGLGRLEHTWASPAGGLYLSVVSELPERSSLFPLAIGVSVRGRLAERYEADLRLKWPNDLVVERPEGRIAKVGGLLVDRVEAPDGGSRAVVGIGLNVRGDRASFPAELRDRVAFLSELTESFPTLRLLETLVTEAVGAAVERLGTDEGASQVVADYQRRLAGLGLVVRVDGRTAGVLRGISEDGAATIEADGELRRIVAGDLEVGSTG